MYRYFRRMRLLAALVLIVFATSCANERHAGRSRADGPRVELLASVEAERVESNADQKAPVSESIGNTPIAAAASMPSGDLPTRPDATSGTAQKPSRHVVISKSDHIQEDENLMPKKKWNKLAIPSFLAAAGTVWLGLSSTSVFVLIAAILVTLALAGISLKRIRTHEQAGKGFAFAALMIGVIATLLTALTIVYYGVD